MRKIVSNMFISLDGIVDGLEDWHFPFFNEEMGTAVDTVFGPADTLLLGRKTYEEHAGAWPELETSDDEDAEFARKLGDARKIVVSRGAPNLSWRNSERLQGELVESVAALKNEPGGQIAVSGSLSIVRQLLVAGLLDELQLLVHPIAVRKGTRLFDEGEPSIPLRLVSSEAFTTGVLRLSYGPVEPGSGATA